MKHEFGDLIADADEVLWRYGGNDLWYPQEELQDGYRELEELERPLIPMVLITKTEHEELKDIAARYRDLTR